MCALNLARAEGQHSETPACLECWKSWAEKGVKRSPGTQPHMGGSQKTSLCNPEICFRTLQEVLGY